MPHGSVDQESKILQRLQVYFERSGLCSPASDQLTLHFADPFWGNRENAFKAARQFGP